MLHNRTKDGKELSKSYLRERQKALENRFDFTADELKYLGIQFPLGGGRTASDTYKIESVFRKKIVDIRYGVRA